MAISTSLNSAMGAVIAQRTGSERVISSMSYSQIYDLDLLKNDNDGQQMTAYKYYDLLI